MKRKSRKNLLRVDTMQFPKMELEEKPPLKDRAKCYNCDKSMPLAKGWTLDPTTNRWGKAETYTYNGIGYFCSRNCAMMYGNLAARRELKEESFNKKQ